MAADTPEATLLWNVANEGVTWRSTVGRRDSYRLWIDEHNYRTVTPQIARLVAAGLVERGIGYQYGAGPVQLTAAGRALLREERSDA